MQLFRGDLNPARQDSLSPLEEGCMFVYVQHWPRMKHEARLVTARIWTFDYISFSESITDQGKQSRILIWCSSSRGRWEDDKSTLSSLISFKLCVKSQRRRKAKLHDIHIYIFTDVCKFFWDLTYESAVNNRTFTSLAMWHLRSFCRKTTMFLKLRRWKKTICV